MQRQEDRRAVIGAVRQPHSLRVGVRLMTFERPVVMGILNVTEDSFYSGCRCTDTAALDARVRQIVSEGAGIIDVGACSTRPGSEPVTPEVETERVLVALDRVRAICDTIPISVDTYRAAVARRAIEAAGIEIINDISSGEMDADMFPLVAETKVGYILTHIQGTPTTMQMAPRYDDLMSDVLNFLAQRVMRLQQMGADNLIIDPGFGFGKTCCPRCRQFEFFKRMRPNPAGREGREGYGIERDVYSEGDGCGGHPADGIFALHVLLHDARHGRDAYIWGYRGDIHAVARGECAEYGSYQHGFRPDYERGATGAGGGVSAGNTPLFALCGFPLLAPRNLFFAPFLFLLAPDSTPDAGRRGGNRLHGDERGALRGAYRHRAARRFGDVRQHRG